MPLAKTDISKPFASRRNMIGGNTQQVKQPNWNARR